MSRHVITVNLELKNGPTRTRTYLWPIRTSLTPQ